MSLQTIETTTPEPSGTPLAGKPAATILRQRIGALLAAGEIRRACRLTAEAAAQYPEDAEIRETHSILNRQRATTGPATGHDIRAEIEWLRDPPEQYRGRWVALIGGRVIASAATARELEASLPSDLEHVPLAVRIGG